MTDLSKLSFSNQHDSKETLPQLESNLSSTTRDKPMTVNNVSVTSTIRRKIRMLSSHLNGNNLPEKLSGCQQDSSVNATQENLPIRPKYLGLYVSANLTTPTHPFSSQA